jgi:hypothetical protein
VPGRSNIFDVLFQLPALFYFSISIILMGSIVCKCAVQYTFNVNEGWNAYWAMVAWTGGDLYPDHASLKLNNYPPLWSYLSGGLGNVLKDNIEAGRILASIALVGNAIIVGSIARTITGNARDAWFAGAVFLSILGLFYGNYIAANDPQVAANLFSAVAILLFLRNLDGGNRGKASNLLIPLMLVGGLLKPNVIAVPISISIFLFFYRPRELPGFALRCAIGLALVCGVAFAIWGSKFFDSVLFSRPYSGAVAGEQILSILSGYNLLLLIVPWLLAQPDPKTRLLSIYAIVALAAGILFSGGFDVDANVFFDFVIAISAGLAVFGSSILEALRRKDVRRRGLVLSCWLAVSLVPPVLSARDGIEDIGAAFGAWMSNPQKEDVSLIRSTPGRTMCGELALCYWAGKSFEVDVNNFKMLMFSEPALEHVLASRLDACFYDLVQLNEDWDDEEGPFTPSIIGALTAHYGNSDETDTASYRKPGHCEAKPGASSR